MQRVTGLGGVFFKCADRDKQIEWYRRHLGLDIEPSGSWVFEWRDKDAPDKPGHTVWGAFKGDTDYFDPSDKPFMINLRVDDLDGMIARLRANGVTLAGGPDDDSFGRFAWVIDPEGTKIELWESNSVGKPKSGES